jgi:hypothetical protein
VQQRTGGEEKRRVGQGMEAGRGGCGCVEEVD